MENIYEEKRVRDSQRHAKCILRHLKERSVIYSFEEIGICFDKKTDITKVKLELKASIIGNFLLTLSFQGVNRDLFFLKSNFIDNILVISLPLYSKYQITKLSVEKELKSQIMGVKNEKVFLNDFLTPLSKKSDSIAYAHHSSNRSDVKGGVDFVVGFKPKGQENVFEVKFNLKSSQRYLDKHIEKYPNVSTFVFSPLFLQDQHRLKKEFFRFLSLAYMEVTHWGTSKKAPM